MKEKAKAKEILQKIIPFLGIILMIIIFQVGGEGKLLTKGNINSILNQTVYIAIMALVQFSYTHMAEWICHTVVLSVSAF